MKIGFDAKRMFTNFTGLGNYSRFVIDALSENANSPHSLVLFTPSMRNYSDVDFLLSRANVTTVLPNILYRSLNLGSVWRSWGLSRSAEARDLDVFHGLSQELPLGLPPSVKKVVSIHDLIYWRYPNFYNPFDVQIYKAKARSACRVADVVVAVSEQTASDLMTFMDVPSAKIHVIYQGCHPCFRGAIDPSEVDRVKRKYGLLDSYILQLGSMEERKNALLSVRALALIPEQKRLPLVLVGKTTPYLKRIRAWVSENGLSPWIQYIERVPLEDLPALYKGATLFIYPSLFEGFGIPLVEAIEVGVPVIAATGSSLNEAAGPDAIYIDPVNPHQLAEKIVYLVDHDQLRKQLVLQQKEHTKKFAPHHIARQLVEVYAS